LEHPVCRECSTKRRPQSLADEGDKVLYFHVLILSDLDACGDPPRFETMRLQHAPKPNYSPGETIHYKCRLGFQPMAPPLPTSAVCQDDNTWSPLQEACTRKLCPNLGDPVNGQVNYVNGSTMFGSQAHYVCNEGFYMIGSRILYCEISGNNVIWDDNPPLCERILCATPRNITNGRITNYKDEYEYNEIVTYSCNPSDGPDEYSLVGESVLVCVDSDRWSSDSPQCKVVKCEYPVVEHGKMVFRKKFYYKSQVAFECNQGFYLHGSNTIVCGANSTWEPKIPMCTKGTNCDVSMLCTSHRCINFSCIAFLHVKWIANIFQCKLKHVNFYLNKYKKRNPYK
uniref:Sushi domain-containing protein n=1 Tax=Monodon monoceros TaxID=40151 RepID=A0A8C6C6L2_MONMO